MRTLNTLLGKSLHILTAFVMLTFISLTPNKLNAQLYSYDFNTDAMGWTTATAGSTCLGLSTVSNHWALNAWGAGGTQSYGNTNIGSLGAENTYIVSPMLSLPASFSLTFDSYSNNESGFPCSYDVEFVEYSTDGGATWNSLVTAFDPLLHNYGMSVWSTLTYSATITPTATGMIRFRYDTGDGCCGPTGTTGWYIDNVVIDETGGGGPTGGAYYIYSNTTGGEPWFSTTNTTAMNTVFGTEGVDWTRAYYETVDVGAAFGPDNCFVFLEGSDSHAAELETFLTANMATIETWVSNGGKLLLNSAPNEGDGMSFGFSGTSLVYDGGAGSVSAADGTHPIFNGPYVPCGTAFTGTNFSHARVTGTGLTSVIIETGSSDITLAEKVWGSGIVMFGGMTTSNWHSPVPNANNLRANIISYLSCVEGLCPAPTGLTADAITATTADLSWDASDNSGGYHLSVYTTDEVLVLKKKVLGGATSWTVTGLTAGTDYAFHVRSICTALGTKSPITDHYYFSTPPARLGEEITSVSLYPNPNNGQFTLALNGYENNAVELNIYSSTGQVVYSSSINVNAADYTEMIDLGNVAPGMYQVSLTGNANTTNYSIVITE